MIRAAGRHRARRTRATSPTTPRSRGAVAAANDDLGRISGVVTAAGIFHGPDLRPAHEVSVDDFMAVLRVNLVGHVRGDQARAARTSWTAAARSSRSRRPPRSVVTVSARATPRARAASTRSTRLLAVQYGPHGVRANCICPGGVDTPMTGGHVRDTGSDRAREAHGAARASRAARGHRRRRGVPARRRRPPPHRRDAAGRRRRDDRVRRPTGPDDAGRITDDPTAHGKFLRPRRVRCQQGVLAARPSAATLREHPESPRRGPLH